jgi:XrtJ-associated TM-motif-TM protein
MMRINRTLLLIGLALVLAAAIPVRAQSGCVDSPEDPTIILALVGGVGALVAGLGFARIRRH